MDGGGRRLAAGRCAAAGLLLLTAAPSAAQEQPATTSLKTVLLAALTGQGIEIDGADQLGEEPASDPALPFSVRLLPRLLAGYSYALEFAPPQEGATGEPRLRRIHIIGRASQPAPAPPQPLRSLPGPAVPNAEAQARPVPPPLLVNTPPVDPLSVFGRNLRQATGGAAPPR